MEQRGSDKHGSRLDELQKQETEGLIRGGGTTHAEEWKEPEPTITPGGTSDASADALLTAPRRPPGHQPGTAEGITPENMERRSELARWVGDTRFPADRDALLTRAEERYAPDSVINAVRSLPSGEKYANIGQVAVALGLGIEERRW